MEWGWTRHYRFASFATDANGSGAIHRGNVQCASGSKEPVGNRAWSFDWQPLRRHAGKDWFIFKIALERLTIFLQFSSCFFLRFCFSFFHGWNAIPRMASRPRETGGESRKVEGESCEGQTDSIPASQSPAGIWWEARYCWNVCWDARNLPRGLKSFTSFLQFNSLLSRKVW